MIEPDSCCLESRGPKGGVTEVPSSIDYPSGECKAWQIRKRGAHD